MLETTRSAHRTAVCGKGPAVAASWLELCSGSGLPRGVGLATPACLQARVRVGGKLDKLAACVTDLHPLAW